MMSKKLTSMIIILIIGTTAIAEVKSPQYMLEEAKKKIKNISIDELKVKMDKEENFILIDIRTEREYISGHIKNAKWIPRGKLEFAIQTITKDPKSEIIIYCRSGGRSCLSTCALTEIGYENAYNLEGGFKKWVSSGKSAYNMHGEIKVVEFEKKECIKDE